MPRKIYYKTNLSCFFCAAHFSPGHPQWVHRGFFARFILFIFRRPAGLVTPPCVPPGLSGNVGRLLFVHIQLMRGAARINLLSVNASSDDPNGLGTLGASGGVCT